MATFVSFLIRVFVVIAAALFAASVAVAFVVLVGVWSVRAAWAKLTGRPVRPFVMRVDPRSGFDKVYRRAEETRAQGPYTGPTRELGDVTDVEAKPPAH